MKIWLLIWGNLIVQGIVIDMCKGEEYKDQRVIMYDFFYFFDFVEIVDVLVV